MDQALPAALEPGALVAKVGDLIARHEALREEVQQAQEREAQTRIRLGGALAQAMADRMQAQRAAAASTFAAYRLAARRMIRPRRRNRLSRTIDRVLGRLGPVGQAVVIARSGLWRASGQGPLGRLRDLAAIARYVVRGGDPDAQPQALFDQAWYLAASPDLAGGRLSPLAHYLLRGGVEGRSPHPLLHPAFYQARNAEALGATGLSPLEHFVRQGAGEGRDPHPVFSLEHYVAQVPDLAASGANPLEHYVRHGGAASPHTLFSPAFYLAQARETPAEAPLVDYMRRGSELGLKPHPLFDPTDYRARYDDVAKGGHEALTHYAMAGGVEGRNPGPWFDAGDYRIRRGAALAPDRNPLVDYLEGGAWSVGEPWLDLQDPNLQGMTPLEAWARRGL